MALTIGELVAYITADDRGFRRGTRRAEQDMARFTRDTRGRLHDAQGRFVREGEEAGHGYGSHLARAAGRALKAGFGAAGKILGPLTGLPLKIAAIASTAVTAAPLLAHVAGVLVSIGQAALSAAPALLAFAAAGIFVKATLTKIFAEGSAARKALSPLGDMFNKAGEAASRAAARGIKPLAQAVARVAGPVVQKNMVRIGQAVNRVMKDFLNWGKSAAGLKAIRGILDPIGKAVERLAPKISKLAISFVSMLGRITGVSVAAGEKGLGGALDWLSAKLDKINKASVQGGLSKLKQTFLTIKNVVTTVADWIRKLADAIRVYNTQFRALADVVSIAAIAFGGPLVAAIGAAGLIIRHFDEVKAVYEKLKAAFSNPVQGGVFDNLKKAGAEVLPALQEAFGQIKEAVLPVLQEIWTKISTELVPAFTEFLAAAAPVVSWLVGVLGPVIASTFQNILSVISGVLDIIIGLFEVFTGILTGDWSKAWDGIKQILSGAWKIILAILKQAINLFKGTFFLIVGVLKGIMIRAVDGVVDAARALGRGVATVFRNGWAAIKGALVSIKNRTIAMFSGAGRWLWNAGKSILQGLINGITSMIGSLKSKLGEITGMIPNLKGPMSVDLRLLKPSGAALMSGLIDGITGAVPALTRTLGGVTAGIPGAAAAGMGGRGGSAPAARVILDVRGGDDALIKVVKGWIRSETGGDVQAALGQGQ